MLKQNEVNLLIHAVEMELGRLSSLQSKANDVKKFNDGYANHIKALHNVKSKLENLF